MFTCAKCGDKKELCNSVKIDGIQQPRICKECLIKQMTTGDEEINLLYWMTQIQEMNEITI